MLFSSSLSKNNDILLTRKYWQRFNLAFFGGLKLFGTTKSGNQAQGHNNVLVSWTQFVKTKQTQTQIHAVISC